MELVEIARWLATGTGICAAIAVAMKLGPKITGIGFLVFLISSVSWMVAGYLDDMPPLILQNAVLTVINIIGVYRWLIVKS